MKRIIVSMVMAATALMPVVAGAQDRGGDGRRDGRDRIERGPDGSGEGRGGRGDGGRSDYRGALQGQPQWQRPDGPQAGFQGRPDRGWQVDRGDRDNRGGDYRGQFQGRADGRGDRDYRQDRGQWNRQANDRRDQYRDQRGFQERSAWNRGWRDDGRYDWNRYRAGNRGAYRLPRYYGPQGWNRGYQRYSIGLSLNSVLFGQNYWIDDPYAYRLPDAYGPYRWVRYYNDALLVDLRGGRVIDAVYGIFW